MMMVRMIVVVAVAEADPADMVMVARLRRAGVAFVADDLGAVFAQLAVHRRLAFADFRDPLAERVEHRGMVAQIGRLDELDLGKPPRRRGARSVDALYQDAGEQKIRKDDDAAKPEPCGMGQRRVDARVGDAAERGLGPAEPHPLPQHARDLGDVGIGVGVVGAAADDDQQSLRPVGAVRGQCRGDAVGRRIQQLRVDREVAAEPHLDPRVVGGKAVDLPGQVVFDVACGEQHARHRQNPPRAARRQRGEPVADRRPGEFEIAGREIHPGQTRAQRRRQQFELDDRLGVAAAVAAEQHRRLGHRLTLRHPRPRVPQS